MNTFIAVERLFSNDTRIIAWLFVVLLLAIIAMHIIDRIDRG